MINKVFNLFKRYNKNQDIFQEYDFLLKSFHRAFQLREDSGVECKYDHPTLLISNNFETIQKINFHNHSLHMTESKKVEDCFNCSNINGKKILLFKKKINLSKKNRKSIEKQRI